MSAGAMYFCALCNGTLTTRVVIEAGIKITEANPCVKAECRAVLDAERASAGLDPLPSEGPRFKTGASDV